MKMKGTDGVDQNKKINLKNKLNIDKCIFFKVFF
jgi:hypothetical protein